MKATEVNAGPAESNGRLLLGIWRDSLHVTCALTACTPRSAPGPTLGNVYGKTLPLFILYGCTRLSVLLGWARCRTCLWLEWSLLELTALDRLSPLYSATWASQPYHSLSTYDIPAVTTKSTVVNLHRAGKCRFWGIFRFLNVYENLKYGKVQNLVF